MSINRDTAYSQVIRTYGRRVMIDPRDRAYRRAAVKTSTRRKRLWTTNAIFLDQIDTPYCVGFSWSHWLLNDPINQFLDPNGIYKIAQQFDEWSGDGYDGTSVRAGAKVLKMLGFIERYEWATTAAQVTQTLLEAGPMVLGIDWHVGMETPAKNGLIRATGENLGGHAILADGIDLDFPGVKGGAIRLKNSWGRSWGSSGRCWLPISDLTKLLKRDGEACIAIEKTPTPAAA